MGARSVKPPTLEHGSKPEGLQRFHMLALRLESWRLGALRF
jgi:hypothetical protein